MPIYNLEIARIAATEEPRAFVGNILFNDSPFAFKKDSGDYNLFVREISDIFEVDISGIRLVGSGSLGFSLHPEHLLSSFGRDSDLDVVITSAEIFSKSWIDLLNLAMDTLILEENEKRLWKKSLNNISEGFMRPDQMPLSCYLVRNWFPRIAGPYESRTARQHEVKAWLFYSLEHAIIFYSKGIRKVQPNLIKLLKVRGDTQ